MSPNELCIEVTEEDKEKKHMLVRSKYNSHWHDLENEHVSLTMHYALQDTQLMTGCCSHLAKPQLSPLQHRHFSSIIIWALLRRYAEFAAAIVGINETFPHEQMNRLLAVLQEEVTEWNYLLLCSTLFCDGATKLKVESLILRLASKFPGRRDQLLFLINNYDVVRLNWCTVCISHVTLNQEQL